MQAIEVQGHTLSAIGDVQGGLGGGGRAGLSRPFLSAFFAVEHIGPCDLMVTAAHQAELDMVLHVFDVESAATWARAQQGTNHGLGELVNRLTHAG